MPVALDQSYNADQKARQSSRHDVQKIGPVVGAPPDTRIFGVAIADPAVGGARYLVDKDSLQHANHKPKGRRDHRII